MHCLLALLIYDNNAISADDIVNRLFPNIPVFIAHIFATIVLILVLWRWVYRPFRIALHARHIAIKDKLDDVATKQALANKDRFEAQQNITFAKIEAQKILSQAKTEIYDLRKTIIDKAHTEANRIEDKAKTDILMMKDQVKTEISSEIKKVSIDIAKQILHKEIDEKRHKELIDEFISDLKNQQQQ